jgi:uncharacterized glyoxalase superfamily protein PhnB
MTGKCVPMIHVPDVRGTVQWYQGIGFRVVETYGDGRDGLSFAILAFGSSEVMFNSGGQTSTARRRDVDLYVYTDDVDTLNDRLRDHVEIVEAPHDTFYGMRELIVRDLNGFWVTFGEIGSSEILMKAVDQRDSERVRAVLARGGLTPQTLSAALEAAAHVANDHVDAARVAEIIDLLEKAGAVRPPEVALDTLQAYVGTYRSDEGVDVRVTLDGSRLLAFPGEAPAVRLIPLDDRTFKPLELSDAIVTFDVRQGQAALTFTQGSRAMRLQRQRDA